MNVRLLLIERICCNAVVGKPSPMVSVGTPIDEAIPSFWDGNGGYRAVFKVHESKLPLSDCKGIRIQFRIFYDRPVVVILKGKDAYGRVLIVSFRVFLLFYRKRPLQLRCRYTVS